MEQTHKRGVRDYLREEGSCEILVALNADGMDLIISIYPRNPTQPLLVHLLGFVETSF